MQFGEEGVRSVAVERLGKDMVGSNGLKVLRVGGRAMVREKASMALWVGEVRFQKSSARRPGNGPRKSLVGIYVSIDVVL